MYGIILSSKLIIPNWTDLVNGDEVEEDLAEEEEELPESPTWAPNTWKRAHWLYRLAASCCGAFASSVTRISHTMPDFGVLRTVGERAVAVEPCLDASATSPRWRAVHVHAVDATPRRRRHDHPRGTREAAAACRDVV